jgi:hypothetical protein
MVVHRRAIGCGDWSFDGLHLYGFAAKKAWSRHVVIAMFALIVIYAMSLGTLNLIHHAIMWRAIINGTLFGGASVWYLYFKRNVTEYFRELAKR